MRTSWCGGLKNIWINRKELKEHIEKEDQQKQTKLTKAVFNLCSLRFLLWKCTGRLCDLPPSPDSRRRYALARQVGVTSCG
jgi:hypothetical protein